MSDEGPQLAKRRDVDQLVALAPAAASKKMHGGLASPRRWSQLGGNESLVRGRLQGTAKEHYHVTVDPTEPGFSWHLPEPEAALSRLVNHSP
jgi:hypothetical protein